MAEQRRPSASQMQAACDRFNARHHVGDEVTVYTGPVGENPKHATIRYPAQILSGHTPVVYVTGGHHGCVALTHVAKATQPQDSGREG